MAAAGGRVGGGAAGGGATAGGQSVGTAPGWSSAFF